MHTSTPPSAAQPETIEFDTLPLPEMRQDLRLIEGGASGSNYQQDSLWRIHDPLAHRFFTIDRDAMQMLSQWRAGTVGAMRIAVARVSGHGPDDQQIATLIEFLQRNELVRPVPQQTFTRVRQLATSGKRSPGSRLLHGYLFFKIPLVRPDAFLRRTLPLLTIFFQPFFWIAVAILGLFSLYLVSRQWDAFLHTFPDMFSVAGVLTFGLSLALVKTLHELGHGYTAVRMGSRVSTMGVAFVVMTPILYTDTTDAWRLPLRRQRVLIDIAGMVVELLVAVVATFAWVFLPDGVMRHAAFALATTGWVLSLAVNLNPLMRFDGYYLFSDLIGFPGLQDRSFAMARWWMREVLFGYCDDPPEPLYGRIRSFLIGFAFATWIYRFFLFLGIALLVYHYFFKLLGVFLFGVEIIWFIAMPIWREIKVWLERRHEAGNRVRITTSVLLVLLAVLLVPFPYTVRIPAVLTATQQMPTFAPRPAQIERVLVQQGDPVQAGQLLIALIAPEIDQQVKNARDTERLLLDRLNRRGADQRDLSETLVLSNELSLERDRITGLERERARLAVRSPIDGIVAELTPELSPGRWIDDKTRLVLVAKPGALEARGYVEAADVKRIQKGDQGEFVDDLRIHDAINLKVIRIGAAATDQLYNWMLASTHGGVVPSRLYEGKALSEDAVFEVISAVEDASQALPMTEIRGEMQIRGAAQSLGGRILRRVAYVLIRESGA
jgi:putative peptide zinc metalloprotease protein